MLQGRGPSYTLLSACVSCYCALSNPIVAWRVKTPFQEEEDEVKKKKKKMMMHLKSNERRGKVQAPTTLPIYSGWKVGGLDNDSEYAKRRHAKSQIPPRFSIYAYVCVCMGVP
ncbi:hypothetical protein P153DRAFT_34863 [Dothidotthia symphoricarpi CBS 119687]|uniref:Uncharacterized protein n=1 Tax=Dothidotthia symphoricarpi CBS 119687 TaxID=1392245 RepID=A0A6A6ABQ9_9PLEO|nr:uncharacterized protein P153DRAFT_34863 [Dothidotthia symphoricarpi CBS 119687]KAF2128328.1 hypothetical protein P153DRAFT_34863 [Dothidotthia symphoricarpi CBS 119687]